MTSVAKAATGITSIENMVAHHQAAMQALQAGDWNAAVSQAQGALFEGGMAATVIAGEVGTVRSAIAETRASRAMTAIDAARIGIPVRTSTNPLAPVLEYDGLGNEILYRTMSPSDYRELMRTGMLPATSETFVSPLAAYSAGYDGVLVRFAPEPGTMGTIMQVGSVHNSTLGIFPDLPVASSGWTRSGAMFKLEGTGQAFNNGLGVVNTGLVEARL